MGMREARLDQLLKAHPAGLPLPEACWLVGRAAHAIATQPRALTPDQVRVREDGGVRVAPGATPVPFGYQAPEELSGKGANVRSAVFSLGALFVEVATGRPAFHRETDFETRIAVTTEEVAPFVGRVAQATPEIDALVTKALAKHPADRFTSTVELGEELDRFLEESLLEVSQRDLAKIVRPLLPKDQARPAAQAAPAAATATPAPEPPAPEPPPEAHAFAEAELELQPEQRRASVPNKPRFDQDVVRVGDPLEPGAGAGVTEASVTGVRESGPKIRRPSAAGLLEIDEDALEEERSRAGTMAPRDEPGPEPNWIMRIAVALIGLVVLAIAYQFLIRPLLLD